MRWGYVRAGGAGAGLEEGVVAPKHDAMCGVRRARHPLVSAAVVRTECGGAETRAEVGCVCACVWEVSGEKQEIRLPGLLPGTVAHAAALGGAHRPTTPAPVLVRLPRSVEGRGRGEGVSWED